MTNVQEAAQDDATGGSGNTPSSPGQTEEEARAEARNALLQQLPDIDADDLEEFIDASLKIYELTTGSSSPAGRVAVLNEITRQVAAGEIIPTTVAELANVSRAGRLEEALNLTSRTATLLPGPGGMSGLTHIAAGA